MTKKYHYTITLEHTQSTGGADEKICDIPTNRVLIIDSIQWSNPAAASADYVLKDKFTDTAGSSVEKTIWDRLGVASGESDFENNLKSKKVLGALYSNISQAGAKIIINGHFE